MIRSKELVNLNYYEKKIILSNINNKRISLYINNNEVDFIYFKDWKNRNYTLKSKIDGIYIYLRKKFLGFTITVIINDTQVFYKEEKFKYSI